MKQIVFPFCSISICTVGYFFVTSSPTLAQVTSDGTVNTQVNQNGNVAEITGGETRGGNLFHSFQDFSVQTGNEAFFNNADSISNIFSRVTGGNISNIDGAIRANGSASLFLINPTGIIFGESARLDIGGSFYASTASSILFEDGEFSVVNNLDQPILTVNAPIGLRFRDNPGDIVNRSVADVIGLSVLEGQNISLIGGNVNIENGGIVFAPGGKIELGGLREAGTIEIAEDNSLNFPNEITRGNVSLTNSSLVGVFSDGGGSININAANLELASGSSLAGGINLIGLPDAQAGDITIDAVENITLDNSFIFNQVQPGFIGNAGNIIINTTSFSAINGSTIDASTVGLGDAGAIDITAESLSLSDRTLVNNSIFGIGDAKDITLNVSDEISLNSDSSISSIVFQGGIGDAGDIIIQTRGLTLNDGSQIGTAVLRAGFNSLGGTGNGGNIIVNATDFVDISGIGLNQLDIPDLSGDPENQTGLIPTADFSSGLIANTELGANGNAGNITVTTDSFRVVDGGIVNSTTSNPGRGGNIAINANQFEAIDGGQVLTTSIGNSGDAGNIKINVTEGIDIIGEDPNFEARLARANQFGSIQGGRVIVENQGAASGIFANTSEDSSGKGGNIEIGIFELSNEELVLNKANFTQNITLSNGGTISATSQGQGAGGNIILFAENISLSDNSQIVAETNFPQSVDIVTSEINLSILNDLFLRDNSSISARAFDEADGGNLEIDARFIVAFPNGNNDILASAQQGQGGNIIINAESLFGIQERTLNNSTNDINASSGISGLDGIVSISTPDVNPVRGTVELPSNIVTPEQTTQQACEANRELVAKSGLNIEGKGGIVPDPGEPLDSLNVYVNGESTSAEAIPAPVETAQGKIQPARGILVTDTGEIILTPYRTDNAGNRIPTKRSCG